MRTSLLTLTILIALIFIGCDSHQPTAPPLVLDDPAFTIQSTTQLRQVGMYITCDNDTLCASVTYFVSTIGIPDADPKPIYLNHTPLPFVRDWSCKTTEGSLYVLVGSQLQGIGTISLPITIDDVPIEGFPREVSGNNPAVGFAGWI